MPFSFTLSGFFFSCIFLCVPNVTSYNSEGLLCKVLIADWLNSAFPNAFPSGTPADLETDPTLLGVCS